MPNKIKTETIVNYIFDNFDKLTRSQVHKLLEKAKEKWELAAINKYLRDIK